VEAGSADFIIFAGDYAEEEVWEQACSLGLTFAVHGNIDARLCLLVLPISAMALLSLPTGKFR